ncbi:hypothetical protein ABE438_07315 [Bosea sp. TWI1241]|jgi:hypothetical protein|uniref:hypothetical protein n=1 Tax=Bosea sp. TWI1241 TaxID=3148904 RepID=UPI00320AE131
MSRPDADEERIIRIARAMCRSARIDPDSILDERNARLPMRDGPGSSEPLPAWTAFRADALAFAAECPPEAVRLL